MNNIEFEANCQIKDITTYKTQGAIPLVIYPKTTAACKEAICVLEKLNLPYFVIGNGSNLLINPKTQKVCISLKKMRGFIKAKDNVLSMSASTPIAKAIPICKNEGLSGLEKIATIPASVGGLIKNNASFLGEEAFSCLSKITMLSNGKIKTIKKEDCKYSYRKTFLPKGLILSASFSLSPSTPEQVADNYNKALSYRSSIQPKGFSCGCVFKNPERQSAGFLIEQCGLKGKEKNDAIISHQHGNFIINRGNATFEDILYLIEYCEEEVKKKYGIALEREVEIIQ